MKTRRNPILCLPLVVMMVLSGISGRGEIKELARHHSLTDAGLNKLKMIPRIRVNALGVDAGSNEIFEIVISQPLDHENPSGEQFPQHILLVHRDYHKPVVLITEGYSLGKNYISELSNYLDANEIRVEHRFFGSSFPDCLKWEFLTLSQAAQDCHQIIRMLKPIYPSSWVSAGWSKGGQTSLAFRHFFPDDVCATVAYDAPINFAQEDSRLDRFFDQVGSPYCRDRLIEFQHTVLQCKDKMLPLLVQHADERGIYFPMGFEAALEYAVLEYPFSFWQYHHLDCKKIPGPQATPQEIFNHLRTISGFSSYSQNAFESPSFYQFFTELGYYGYVTDHIKDLLKTFPRPLANVIFAPTRSPLKYKPELMKDLNQWLQSHGNNILYIYGEQDPWSATGIDSAGKTNALKMTLKGGNHFTFISSFPENDRELMVTTIKKWLGIN